MDYLLSREKLCQIIKKLLSELGRSHYFAELTYSLFPSGRDKVHQVKTNTRLALLSCEEKTAPKGAVFVARTLFIWYNDSRLLRKLHVSSRGYSSAG